MKVMNKVIYNSIFHSLEAFYQDKTFTPGKCCNRNYILTET